jgi:radical SAM protein with 4Fe4S-binding SPASM domain
MDWQRIKPWLWPVTEVAVSQTLSVSQSLLQPGLKHYRTQRDGQAIRYHLRIEPNGSALLMVAAVEAVRLTESGALAAVGLLEGHSEQQILASLQGCPDPQAVIHQVRQVLQDLGAAGRRRYPILNLRDTADRFQTGGLLAPLQADIDWSDLNQLKRLFHVLWQAGLPHIRLMRTTPQQANSESEMPDAVEAAEDIGLITGVRANAGWLMERLDKKCRLQRLAESGLDYVAVPWCASPTIHSQVWGKEDWAAIDEVIQAALGWDLPVVLEAGLTRPMVDHFESHLDHFACAGLTHVETYALVDTHEIQSAAEANPALEHSQQNDLFAPQNLKQLAAWVEDLSMSRRIQIAWLPSMANRGAWSQDSIRMCLQVGPRSCGEASIRVTGKGEVIAPFGEHRSIGSLLEEPWSAIWTRPEIDCYRSSHEIQRCSSCAHLSVCYLGCPSDSTGWAIEQF